VTTVASFRSQKRCTKSGIEFPIVIGNFFALTNGATCDNVAVEPMGIGIVRMIHVVIVIDGQKDFAIHSVPVVPDIIPCRFGQFCELRGRVDPVEAINEAPDLRAFANNFVRKNTKTVNGAFIKVSFNKKHGSYRGGYPRVANERRTRIKRHEPAPAEIYAAGLRSVFSRLSR
jgi:hypothetical protein